ncbi:uncharacterized protein LOC126661306 isoform X2 [Mercurialis annua]|uniref:uncharacterized protein LOC126661306 isoform X2 n=1 Tax=Mercurialis annua TaxID=3986 RepID=UPI0024AEC848|nr:uncharacterized protein LOC126661306 isoform X2 [Mercurialis annua]
MECRSCISGFRELKPLVHLLLPLSVHWVAEQMTVSVLVDVVTRALCPGQSTCSQAIYITGLQQTVVGIFKMIVLPLLGQLADEYGRKPFLILTVSTSIFPFAILAYDQSKGFVYAYYVLRTISFILSQGSIFCISVAYAADFVPESKRAAVFSWMTGLFSASHVIGNVLARFLPEKYIFLVSIALLLFGPIYMQIFLVDTVNRAERKDHHNSTLLTKTVKVFHTRCKSMTDAASLIISSPTLRGISFVSFFYELGMTGISSVLFFYLKSVFGFNKNQYSEILLMVGVGEIFSQAFFYGLAWASWVAYLGAAFGAIFVLVTPSTYAIISKASSSANQGKAQGFVAGVQSIASLLSPLAMSPLTSLFLSKDAPFNCKGFSIIVASVCMMVALCYACLLKPEQDLTRNSDEEIETPLLTNS